MKEDCELCGRCWVGAELARLYRKCVRCEESGRNTPPPPPKGTKAGPMMETRRTKCPTVGCGHIFPVAPLLHGRAACSRCPDCGEFVEIPIQRRGPA